MLTICPKSVTDINVTLREANLRGELFRQMLNLMSRYSVQGDFLFVRSLTNCHESQYFPQRDAVHFQVGGDQDAR